MREPSSSTGSKDELTPYLSPLAVWALSVGTAIGWGSLVVTSGSYLSQAGPAGSLLGLFVGFAMMAMMVSHYSFLARQYPGVGGLYNYVKHIFGYDRAFLVGWFMFLTYISIFWANATSIPLFARYFLQGALKVGYLYTVFSFEVYLGEALVTLLAIVLVAILCARSRKATANTMVVLVLLFCLGITVCFVVAMVGHGSSGMNMEPAFVHGKSALEQVVRIAFLSPWAFIGFETVTNSSAENRLKSSNSLFRVMFVAVVVTTALYMFVILLSVSAYPEGCTDWLDYITHLDQFEGIAGLPAFYAAHYYLGDTGVHILMASLVALVATSLIGNLRALSRLCYAAAQDGILSERFTRLNDKRVPSNAILLVVLVSLPIPFLGKTAVGWIVDTTTFGATILYGFAAMAVLKVARREGCKKDTVLGAICVPILIAFLGFLLLPELFSDYTIASETYALMIVWSILGLVFFNMIIRKDQARNFGKSIIVWAALLAFIVTLSLTWASRINKVKGDVIIDNIASYMDGTADNATLAMDREEFLAIQRDRLSDANRDSVLTIAGLFALSLGVLLVNYFSMRKWEQKAAKERDEARIVAFTDPLTGMGSKHAYAMEESAMEARIVEGDDLEFGVVVCDVNGLKRINDTLGHKAGDEYIRAASQLLRDYYTRSPIFRIGGDEFVVLLEGRDYEDRDKILESFNRTVEDNVGSGEVVASLGVAEFDCGVDQSFHEVFKRADRLMYERKAQLKRMGAVTRD